MRGVRGPLYFAFANLLTRLILEVVRRDGRSKYYEFYQKLRICCLSIINLLSLSILYSEKSQSFARRLNLNCEVRAPSSNSGSKRGSTLPSPLATLLVDVVVNYTLHTNLQMLGKAMFVYL